MIEYKIESFDDVSYGDFQSLEQELGGLTRQELEEIQMLDIDEEFDIDFGVTVTRIS